MRFTPSVNFRPVNRALASAHQVSISRASATVLGWWTRASKRKRSADKLRVRDWLLMHLITSRS